MSDQDNQSKALANYIAARHARIHELAREMDILRGKLLFWRIYAVGITLAAIVTAIVAR